jgi:glycosyltransferase involved in cell wall biosynthesis
MAHADWGSTRAMTETGDPRPPRSVLFVVPRFHTNLAGAVRTLDRAGCRVHVFCLAEGSIEDHSIVMPRIFPASTPAGEIRRAIREAAPDLVFLRGCKPLSRVVGAYCRLRGLRAYSYGLSSVTQRPALGRQIERFLHGQPLRRITPVRGLDASSPADRHARYLPWPVEAVAGVSPAPDPASGPLRILCVGKLSQPRKNQHRLIAALDDLNRPGEISLTLVGSSSAEISGADLQHWRLLSERATEPAGRFPVCIRADVPFAGMPEIYAQHQVCVLPADREPLGMAPLEAMAYGVVPVFSRACGSAGSVTPGEDGFVVDVHDPRAMRELFTRLLDDRDLVRRVGQAARRTAEGPLGPAAFLARIARLCEA